MIALVAVRNVFRHRLRTTFTVLALAIAVALLADMMMLSTGMEQTFHRVLASLGYEVRLCPYGTLPLTTDAVIPESGRIAEALAADARVERWLRVLATTLYADSIPLFVMGIDGEDQSLYRVVEGRDIDQTSNGRRVGVAVDRNAAAALGVGVGDVLRLGTSAPAASIGSPPGVTAVVTGIVEIGFDLPSQRTAILPLKTVQRLRSSPTDAASFVLVKLAAADPSRDAPFVPLEEQRPVASSLAHAFPELSVYAIDSLLEALQRQLAYFKQFARILSTISVFVTFLLVAVVLTIGVEERRGEIAALRGMGFRRRSIQWMVLAESVTLLALGSIFGAVLGWVLSGYLDHILTQSPSLPAGYRFFVPAPREIALAVALAGATGVVATLIPALQAARVDIPRTLHEEVV